MMLNRILRPKEELVRSGWKTLHNEKYHNLYWLPNKLFYGNQIKECEMRGAYRTHEKKMNSHKKL
jgi:hypothetical protein